MIEREVFGTEVKEAINGTECPDCTNDMFHEDEYTIDGITWPLSLNFSKIEELSQWQVIHKCSRCYCVFSYWDNT